MKVVNTLEAPAFANPHGVSARRLNDALSVQINMLTLQPGEAVKSHVTPVDAPFYILQGQGVVEVGAEQQQVSADMLIESPAGIAHGLWNDGSAPFRFLVIKLPGAQK